MRQSFSWVGSASNVGPQAVQRDQKSLKNVGCQGIRRALATQYACRNYWALQVGMVGGQTGFSARTGETLADNANTATAIQSSAFFTVKLLVEVEVAP
jgi:hypothetical protein